jgi:hypothetical protein
MRYTEIGYGNPTAVSTEIETEGSERRVKGFAVGRIRSIYIRIWVGKAVVILDTHDGIKLQSKKRNTVKMLLGIVSE